jgi:hypothetical protein
MEALWQDIWKGLQADFSNVPDVAAVTQLVLRMLLAKLSLTYTARALVLFAHVPQDLQSPGGSKTSCVCGNRASATW